MLLPLHLALFVFAGVPNLRPVDKTMLSQIETVVEKNVVGKCPFDTGCAKRSSRSR
jgi:hypothetical protein